MKDRSTVEEWARTTQLSVPPRWGEIERELLTRAGEPPGHPLLHKLLVAIPITLCVLFILAPVFGLVVILADGDPLSPDARRAAQFAFVIAIAVPYMIWQIWKETPRRHPGTVLLLAGLSAASWAAVVVLLGHSEASQTGWSTIFAGIAGTATVVLLGLVLVRSERHLRTSLPLKIRLITLISPPNEAHYRQARRDGLQILADRGAIQLDEPEREKLHALSLGAWRRRDTTPPQ